MCNQEVYQREDTEVILFLLSPPSQFSFLLFMWRATARHSAEVVEHYIPAGNMMGMSSDRQKQYVVWYIMFNSLKMTGYLVYLTGPCLPTFPLLLELCFGLCFCFEDSHEHVLFHQLTCFLLPLSRHSWNERMVKLNISFRVFCRSFLLWGLARRSASLRGEALPTV